MSSPLPAMLSLCLVLSGGPLPAAEPDDELALAATIDRLIAARLNEAGVKPAPLADEVEFLRRVYLDLIGRIPSATEAQTFLDDKTPDKRRRLVRRLLDHPGYAEHFSNVWCQLLIPEARTNPDVQGQLAGFNPWLRKQFAENVGYDRMVRELLTVRFAEPRVGSRRITKELVSSPPEVAPLAYYLAKEVKPENLAASTSRLFLGVRLECAQCHDHPSAPWTRPQFWGYAAFFAGLQRSSEGDGLIREVFDRRELLVPGGSQSVEARYLDGAEPQWKYNVGSRTTLAEWLTSPTNPYFARTAGNRLWAHLFGVGLIEPVDDLRTDNPPSHPELLDELARQFAAHRFDNKFLLRAIMASQTYQRTSSRAGASAEEVATAGRSRLFARMALKSLTAEQLFDSLALATGYTGAEPGQAEEQGRVSANEDRNEFLALFAATGQVPTEVQTSIQQALTLMNGGWIAEATRGRRGTLPAVVKDATLDTRGRIEALFLATLSRRPTAKESTRLVQFVTDGGAEHNPRQALADVFWVLLNSTEFCVNH